ncbi:MAG: hypothetical protein Ct9H300mP13_7050 [Gammaproteobacteria bacterium]|nr:MAG: hypothetical protein Ct9H300mP13_7050 [Gammaproteobacteria bacterium]
MLDIALLYANVLPEHLKFQIVNIEIDTQTLTTSGFGVEISGIDISKLGERTGQILIDAFNAHGGLLVLRDQGLKNPDHLCQLAALFGDVEHNEKYDPHYLLPDHPEILRVGNTIEHGQYSALFIRADPPPLLWHCDDPFSSPTTHRVVFLLRGGPRVWWGNRFCRYDRSLRRAKRNNQIQD